MQKSDIPDLLYQTLQGMGGSGRLIDVCKVFWAEHNEELEESGDLFYSWQYDIRWAATALRKSGLMKAADQSPVGLWEIA